MTEQSQQTQQTVAGLPGFDLTGRRAIVFAAESPVGRSIADAYREAGAAVHVVGGQPGEAVDLSNATAVDQHFTSAVEQLGGLDIVAYIPGRYLAAPIASTSNEDAQAVIAANLLGAFNVFRSASNAMDGTESGRLIAVVSAASLRGLSNLSAYSASLAGILGLVRSLSQELGPRGITTNAIATGWMSDTPGRGPDAVEENLLLRYIPMRRFGAPEDVAPLAVYLASDASGYVNGHVMAVDGGVLKHL